MALPLTPDVKLDSAKILAFPRIVESVRSPQKNGQKETA
jgi:hypothetical protein